MQLGMPQLGMPQVPGTTAQTQSRHLPPQNQQQQQQQLRLPPTGIQQLPQTFSVPPPPPFGMLPTNGLAGTNQTTSGNNLMNPNGNGSIYGNIPQRFPQQPQHGQ